MPDLVLDPARSVVRLQTFAEGLFARLAHDLELTCGGLRGGVAHRQGLAGTATIEAPLERFEVKGTLAKDGSIDDRGLSPSDRRDCLAKMIKDVFHAHATDAVRVEATSESGSVRVRVIPPNGRPVEVVTRPELREEAGVVYAKGSFDLSLEAIGSDVVKGPMNAFRVKDRVKVLFDVAFALP